MRFLSRAFIICVCITICNFKYSLYGNSIDSLIANAEGLEKSEKFKLAYKNATKALGYINVSTSEKEILRVYEVVLRLAWEQNLLNDTEAHARKLLENYSGPEIDFLGYRYLGHAYMDLIKTEQAIVAYEKALEMRSSKIKENANIHFNLGSIYMDQGKLKMSEEQFLKTLELIKKDESLNDYLAITFSNLSALNYEYGELNKAIKYAEDFLNAEIKFPSDDGGELAWAYFQLGELLIENNDTDGSLANYLKCLDIERKLYDSNSTEILGTLDSITDILLDSNRTTQAIEMIDEGLGIAEKLESEDPSYKAVFAYKKGYQLRKESNFIDSNIYFEASLNIDRRLENLKDMIFTLFYMAENFIELKNHEKAISLAKESLKIEEQLYGSKDESLVDTLDLLLRSSLSISDHKSALLYAQRIRDILRLSNSDDISSIIESNWHYSNQLFFLDRYKESLESYLHTEQLMKENFDNYLKPDPTHNLDVYITSLMRTGICYEQLFNPFLAIQYYKQGLKLLEENEFLKETRYNLYNNLGNAYSSLSDYNSSLKYYEDAWEISESIENIPSPFTNLAILHENLGNLDEASRFQELALREAEKLVGKYSSDYALPLMNYGRGLMEQGEYEKSLEILKDVEEILNSGVSFEIQPGIKQTLMFNFLSVYDWSGNDEMALVYAEKYLKETVMLYGEIHPETSFAHDRLAMCLLENNDSQGSLKHAISASNILSQFLTKQIQELDEDEKFKFVELALLGRKPFDMLAVIGDAKEISNAVLKRKCLSQDSLAGIYSQKSNKTKDRDLNIEDKLPLRFGLLEYVEYDATTLINGIEEIETFYGCVVNYKISNGSVFKEWFVLGDYAPIDESIESIRSKIILSDLKNLHRLLLEPILKSLPKEVDSLIISPDSDLNFVPFSSLVADNNKFLCENYKIYNLSTGRDLWASIANTQSFTEDFQIFANPNFDSTNSGNVDFAQSNLRSFYRMRGLTLNSLPGSENEAFELSKVAKENKITSKVFLNSDASEENLRNLKSPRILHLATHGWFVSETDRRLDQRSMNFFKIDSNKQVSNPMHRGGIALAGAKNSLNKWSRGEFVDPSNDGILTAEEASQLDLSNTWLTVLSACDTGTGIASAGQGVLGLRRALAIAGTENLVLTLWPVDDQFTMDFMVSFYKEALDSGNAPKAMAKVQREWLVKLREERSISQAVKLAGPFVLTFRGNPELN